MHHADETKHAVAPAFLRIEFNRLSRHLQRRIEDSRGCGGIPIYDHSDEGEVGVRESELRIEIDRSFEEGGGAFIAVVSEAAKVGETPQEAIVGGQAVGRFAKSGLKGGIFDPTDQSGGNDLSQLVLHCEHVVELSVVPFRPQVTSRSRLDELRSHAQSLTGSPDAALDEIGNAEATPDIGRSATGSRKTNDELPATTNRDRKRARPVMISSVMPSLK